MAYFIFVNVNNVEGTLYRMVETQNDLNNLNIIKDDYKIIEDTQENFNAVKFGIKEAIKFNNNTINYINKTTKYSDKQSLKEYVENIKNLINFFKENNSNHPSFEIWSNYYNQLNNLNLDSISYPLDKSLEQYFNDLGQPSYNILQMP
jgi:hypothetical protein